MNKENFKNQERKTKQKIERKNKKMVLTIFMVLLFIFTIAIRPCEYEKPKKLYYFIKTAEKTTKANYSIEIDFVFGINLFKSIIALQHTNTQTHFHKFTSKQKKTIRKCVVLNRQIIASPC